MKDKQILIVDLLIETNASLERQGDTDLIINCEANNLMQEEE